MRLLAALLAAVFAYLAVGYLSGYAPNIRWRASRPSTDMSKRQLWLVQAGLNISPVRFWSVSVVLGLFAYLITSGISQAFWVALPPAIVELIDAWIAESELRPAEAATVRDDLEQHHCREFCMVLN